MFIRSNLQTNGMSVPKVGMSLAGTPVQYDSPSQALSANARSTVPMYVSEMSIESTERGLEVAYQCVWLISGVALGYWVRDLPTPSPARLASCYSHFSDNFRSTLASRA
jgi:hypothetical protein